MRLRLQVAWAAAPLSLVAALALTFAATTLRAETGESPPSLAQTTPPGPQSLPPPSPEDDIELEEFRQLFVGRTVYFEQLDGSPWGREYYSPDGSGTVFEFHQGGCFVGTWYQQGRRYCFAYENGVSCWLTWREGETIFVESRSGMRQRIARIVDEPFSCEPEVVSSLDRGDALENGATDR